MAQGIGLKHLRSAPAQGPGIDAASIRGNDKFKKARPAKKVGPVWQTRVMVPRGGAFRHAGFSGRLGKERIATPDEFRLHLTGAPVARTRQTPVAAKAQSKNAHDTQGQPPMSEQSGAQARGWNATGLKRAVLTAAGPLRLQAFVAQLGVASY